MFMLKKVTKHTRSISYPVKMTDLLDVLRSLQSLFVTSRSDFMHPHPQPDSCYPLCISSNERNLLQIEAKGGFIAFYDKKGRSKEVSLEGYTFTEILKKFFVAIKSSNYCTVHTVENEVGNTKQRKINFDIQYKEGKIYLIDHNSENFSGGGTDGNL